MLLSSSMSATPQFATAVYGLAAVVTWGTSDFLGGYATRRANAFLFSTVVNIGGLLLVGTLASTTHAAFPSVRSVLWVLAVLFVPATWAATITAQVTKLKDPQIVVVDEVLGQWIALSGARTLNWKSYLAAFALFRLFDI